MSKIRLVLMVVLCITEISVLAQQPADCLSACSCTMPSMQATTLSTQSTHGPCNTATTYAIDASKFQRIYCIAGNSYEISLCANSADTRLYVTNNSTVPGVAKCDDDGCGQTDGASFLKFSPVVSGTYRIYVFNGTCATTYAAGTMMDMTMTCSVATPANDLPCGAIELPINGSACTFTPGTNEAAFNAQSSVPGVGVAPNCSGASFQGADVWYKFTVPASGRIGLRTQEGTICAGAFQLYTATACNGTFQQLPGGCVIAGNTGPASEPAIVLNAVDAGVASGDIIYIRYWERNGNEPGTFGICAFDPEIAINDEPCAAIPLPLNTTCEPLQFDHDIAFSSEVPLPSCGVISNVQDVWFSFTVPSTIPVGWPGISTQVIADAPMDLAIAWYRSNNSGCLAADLVEIACSATGSITSAAISPSLLNAGETIRVRVWSEVIWNGTYSMCAVMEQAPINDGPCGALDLAVEHGCLIGMYSNAFASTTGTNSTGTAWNGIPAPTCGTPVYDDVWFKLIVPPNGVVQLDMLAGTMTNAAMSLYRVTSGSCTTNNLVLQQVACSIVGSQQGTSSSAMPYASVNNLIAGSTLYVRVWKQAGPNGSFGICARRTDEPIGDCVYTLNMTDANGTGWDGAGVTICIASNCRDFTLYGAEASIDLGVNEGEQMTISYSAEASQQTGNAYSITYHGASYYTSSNPPQTGLVSDQVMLCPFIPEPSSNCLGAIPICNNATYQPVIQPNGVSSELNAGNAGCMAGESHGVWLSLHFGPGTLPCSPIAFDLVPVNNGIFDFAVWGPFPAGSAAANICPLTQLPYRCNWASINATKGLAYNNSLPAYQYGGGGPMSKHMIVNPGDVFILFANQWAGGSGTFNLVWKTPPASFQALTSDCTAGASPAPAGSVASLGCEVMFSSKVILEGPYDDMTGLMNDDLRQLGLVPLIEPFTALGYPQVAGGGGEITNSSILAVTGNNAVVDWVRLELRDPINPSLIVASAHGLLQRDGDIVAADGSAEISFPVAPGNYNMAVRHRNHLGCMSATPLVIGSPTAVVDLRTFSTLTFGNDARKDVNGTAVLWSGNVNGDDRIQYTGGNNDRDPILQEIGGTIPTTVANGYLLEDVNLDGKVKYAGPNNDRDVILINVGGSNPTNVKLEELP